MRHPTTKSIVESLVTEIDGKSTYRKELLIDHTVLATCNKIDQMPYLLKFAMTILVFVFNLHGFVRRGKFFHAQTATQRIHQISKWRESPIRVCREFIVFHEKLTFFVYFSQRDST